MNADSLLTDAQVAAFITDGYIVLQPPEIPSALHATLFTAAADLYDEVRRSGGSTAHLDYLGDHLLTRIPALRLVLQCPTVAGALTGILGGNPVLHPHHFVHSAGRTDQGFHQDGNLPWNTRGHFRSHRPVAAMLFYYPQAVTEDMGPTEVVPGTQFWSGRFEDADTWHSDDSLDRTFNDEVARADDLAYRDRRLAASLQVLPFPDAQRRRLTVPAGSVVIAHYDLVHRGTRQSPGFNGRRFMYKFYYLRMHEPDQPTWNNRSPTLATEAVFSANEPIMARIWAWLRGTAAPSGAPEDIAALIERLHSPTEDVRRAAGYALGYAGAAAVDALSQALTHPHPNVRRMAAFALGETRCASATALAALTTQLTDADELVRSNAAFSLGSLARIQPLPTAAIDALFARLDTQAEPDNTNSAGLTRSTVRECAVHALLQAARNGGLSDAQREQLAVRGQHDTDRYVQGLALAAARCDL